MLRPNPLSVISSSISPRAIALALLILLFGEGVPLRSDPLIAAETYLIAPGDRLSITVFGEANLSGDFVVDGAGNIQLPLLGDILVRDFSLKEIEQGITQRLNGYLQAPAVSIRIAEFRPIYILGDVKAPGSYPFRYGDTVLTAVALAGGFGAAGPEALVTAAKTDFLAAHERVRVLEAAHWQIIVRQARLEAQQKGEPSFEVPGIPIDDDNLKKLIAEEHGTLVSQAQAHQKNIALLRKQIPRLEAQIKSVEEQSRFEADQLRLIRDALVDYRKLLKSGLAQKYTGIEFQREEARNLGNIAGYHAQITTLQVAIGDIEAKIHDAETAYRQRVGMELQETRPRFLEIETTLPLAREIREIRAQQGSAVAAGETTERRILILRRQKSEPRTIVATDTTGLVPGDIIEVTSLASEANPSPTLSFTTDVVNGSAQQKPTSVGQIDKKPGPVFTSQPAEVSN